MTVLRIIGQRQWLIVGCAALFTVITFVVTLAWQIYAPRYTAVARLGVGRPGESAFGAAQPEPAEGELAGLKAGHAEMLKRDSVLIRAVESPEVQKTAWYQRDPEGSLKRLPEILTVTPARTANMISIEITEVAPQKQDRIDLAEIANAVAMAYVMDVRAAASQGYAMHIKCLRDKLAELREISDLIQMEIKRKKLPEIQILHEQMKAQGVRLQALAAKGIELELAKIEIEASLKGLEKQTKAAGVQAEALREQLRVKLESVTGQLLSVEELVARINDTVLVALQRKLVTMRDLQAREKSIAESVAGIDNTLLQLELLADTDRPVWVCAKATRPRTITSPRWNETMPLGALIGLAVGLVVAFSLGLKTEADGSVDSLTG